MRKIEDILSRPTSFAVTTALLFALFGWTFITNSDRVAPTKDPAFYTWRTEALLSEDPATVIEIEGPLDVFAAGYRVTAPVLGGFLRQVPNVGPLKTTVILMVVLPVLIALLLAGFAYRYRRDPLIWHAVALGTGSLLLTPPFVGYLDNVLTLFFLAAALWFLSGARDSWPSRIGFAGFLVLSGLAHPTTLVIFGLVLGTMSAARVVYRKFDLKSVIRDDGPMLITALVAAIAVYLIWKVGIWGKSASLGDAALPPPYEKDFFVDRLELWVSAMTPVLNGPMFLLGAIGLLAAGRRAAEDDLTRISIVWLAPLAGIFGFLAGFEYPYYRFFNTTLSWVLLVALGMYFAMRFFIVKASQGGPAKWALVGVVAIAVIIGVNFARGFDKSGWNNADGGWLSAQEREDLDALRAALSDDEFKDRPVVFVIDTEDHSPRVYGYMKLSSNTSRYGLPHGSVDQGYTYLGSLDNFTSGQPSEISDESFSDEDEALKEDTYDFISAKTLEDVSSAGGEPIVVLAGVFNETGANIGFFDGTSTAAHGDLITVDQGTVTAPDGTETGAPSSGDAGFLHLLWVIAGFVLLLVPGVLALRYFSPGWGAPEVVALAPALAMALLAFAGIIVLAVVRSPFSGAVAWSSWGLATLVGAWLWTRGPRVAGSTSTS